MRRLSTALLAAAVGASLPALALAQTPPPQDQGEHHHDGGGEHGDRGERGAPPAGGQRPDRGTPPAAAAAPAQAPAATPAPAQGQPVRPQATQQQSPQQRGTPQGAPDRGNFQGRPYGRPYPGQTGNPPFLANPDTHGPGYDARRAGGGNPDLHGQGYDDRRAPPPPPGGFRPGQPGGGYPPGYGYGYGRPGDVRPQGNWQRPDGSWRGPDWRQDRRYDWRNFRDLHRDIFRGPRYVAPRGWYGYRRFDVGVRLPPFLFDQQYWIADPWVYRLPPVYGPYRWVRYYDDVLLIDTLSGEVVDVIPDFFW